MQQAIVRINSSRDDIDKSGIENITLEDITLSQTLSQKTHCYFTQGLTERQRNATLLIGVPCYF